MLWSLPWRVRWCLQYPCDHRHSQQPDSAEHTRTALSPFSSWQTISSFLSEHLSSSRPGSEVLRCCAEATRLDGNHNVIAVLQSRLEGQVLCVAIVLIQIVSATFGKPETASQGEQRMERNEVRLKTCRRDPLITTCSACPEWPEKGRLRLSGNSRAWFEIRGIRVSVCAMKYMKWQDGCRPPKSADSNIQHMLDWPNVIFNTIALSV